MQQQVEHYADEYQIISKVGKGGQATVYIGRRHHQTYALKIFEYGASKEQAYRQEVQILSQLNHPNLIRMVDHRPLAKVRVDYEDEHRRPLIVQELAEGGQLFDYLSKTGRFSPQLARFYFGQLLSAIAYLHEKGVVHRDLKPENILFDSNFNLKLTDFGLSHYAKGTLGNFCLVSKVGTDGYRAPEVMYGNYNGLKVDIFALGVILFIMYTATPPFITTHPSDRVYGLIRANNYSKFWQMHEKGKPHDFFPNSLKQLIYSLLREKPQERPSLEQIRLSEWMIGEVPGYPALIAQMSDRAIKLAISKSQKPNLQKICDIQGYRSDLDLQDDALTKQDLFTYQYFTLNINMSELPVYRLNKVIYVVKDANLLVSWIHAFLFAQRKNNNVFLENHSSDMKFEHFQVDYVANMCLISIIFDFSIDPQHETQLILKGELHKTSNGQVGINWIKFQGNSFWLSCIKAHIDESFKNLN